MLTYAKVALALFDLLKWWISNMEKKKLIDQGRSQLLLENLEVQREEFNVAVAARQKVRDTLASTPDSLRRTDPFERQD